MCEVFSAGRLLLNFLSRRSLALTVMAKTILGAAACAYKEIKPGLSSHKSSIGDN